MTEKDKSMKLKEQIREICRKEDYNNLDTFRACASILAELKLSLEVSGRLDSFRRFDNNVAELIGTFYNAYKQEIDKGEM